MTFLPVRVPVTAIAYTLYLHASQPTRRGRVGKRVEENTRALGPGRGVGTEKISHRQSGGEQRQVKGGRRLRVHAAGHLSLTGRSRQWQQWPRLRPRPRRVLPLPSASSPPPASRQRPPQGRS